MSPWESHEFDKLGNEIMLQISSEIDPIDSKEYKAMAHDIKEKRDERMKKLKDSMKATTSSIGYGRYLWNPVCLFPEIYACLCFLAATVGTLNHPKAILSNIHLFSIFMLHKA